MKILSMTATFGKLDNETLTFRDGLNIRNAPNEWGKSTWCSFLTAMFYGIDTRERSRGDQIADKEKFLPWSGKPMEGTIRLLHQGRDITIQRRTRGRVPMGDFLAWETHTGLNVRELTADNCGQVLLGVEKSVFLRTGFLRFTDLPVKADETLRRRLNALVTTGDESGSAELLGGKLRELKNRCRHNQTGLIPECEGQIRQLQEELWTCQNLTRQQQELADRVFSRERELALLENHRQALDCRDAGDYQKLLAAARADARTAAMLERALMEKYTDNPDRSEVKAKIAQAQDLLEEVNMRLTQPPESNLAIRLFWILAAVLVAVGLLMHEHGMTTLCFLAAFLCVFVSQLLVGKKKRRRIWDSIERKRLLGQKEELEKFIESWQSQLRILKELDQARDNTGRTRSNLQKLTYNRPTPQPPAFPDELKLNREDTTVAIRETARALDQDRMRLAQLRGRMEHLTDPEQLQRKLAQARHRLAQLEQTQRAILHAQAALEEATRELQQRFAPEITRRAGQFLSRLTGGVYDRITVGDDLTILAARDREATLRTAQWRSEGTGDQMYLALRLAVWEVLTPESPLILDDALVRFDQGRLEKAMDLLIELSQKGHQILLFSCQEREADYLHSRS